jgi:alanyl-tRNA synthetase
VEFVCGFRALEAARADFAALTQAASLLSCGLPDVPDVLAKLIQKARESNSAAMSLEKRLAEYEGREMLAANPPGTPEAPRIITAALDEASFTYIQHLASALVKQGGVIAMVASRSTGHVMFAKPADCRGDMNAVFREVAKEFGAKGGGGQNQAQGSVAEPAKVDAILARAREILERATR